MIVTQKGEVEERVDDLLYTATQKSQHTRCLTWRLKGQGILVPPLFRSQTFYLGPFPTSEKPLSMLQRSNVRYCKYAVKTGGNLKLVLCQKWKSTLKPYMHIAAPKLVIIIIIIIVFVIIKVVYQHLSPTYIPCSHLYRLTTYTMRADNQMDV
jgi:hypothetical protein